LVNQETYANTIKIYGNSLASTWVLIEKIA
jgi:hypothetical protein